MNRFIFKRLVSTSLFDFQTTAHRSLLTAHRRIPHPQKTLSKERVDQARMLN